MGTLFVVVPGIGGSELRDPQVPGDAGRVWWGDRGAAVQLVRSPEAMDRARVLEPVGLIQGFAVVPWWKNIDPYDRLWPMLSAVFGPGSFDGGDPRVPDLDAKAVAFPYDFRLGVEHAAGQLDAMLRPRLAHLGPDTRVAFIAHSMGGLVARAWTVLHGGFERCRGMVTLGTPHRGAPKALDVLVNGLRWGPIERRRLSDVVRGWQGVHDLVGIDDRFLDTTAGALRRADELTGLPAWMDEPLARATALHQAIADGWDQVEPSVRPAVFPVGGIGHGTICGATWDGRVLARSEDPVAREPRGDATVPFWSAVPFEVAGGDGLARIRRSRARHGALVGGDELRMMIEQLDGADPPGRRGWDRDQPIRGGSTQGLGLDLDDLAEPGRPLLGGLLADGFDLGAARARVDATFVADDGRRLVLDAEVDPSGTFQVDLPADLGGEVVVEASVKAKFVPEFHASDRVAVVA